MKKLILFSITLSIVLLCACGGPRMCRGMKYYNSDRKRGLAH